MKHCTDQEAKNSEASVMDGLEIQARHLKEWKEKLNNDCYVALETYVSKQNLRLMTFTARTGELPRLFDVCRGSDLDNFVANWKKS